MVGETSLKIIREEEGKGTGDRLYQTEDGRWWEKWDGKDRTGQEVRIKTDGELN
jgi:hypothetical protein